MVKLTNNEMKKIKAGSVSGALISAIWTGLNLFTDLGRYVGSSIRRFVTNNTCGF